MKVLVTGGAGLVGATAVDFYASRGEQVTALDAFLRGRVLGTGGNTEDNWEILRERHPKTAFLADDVRSEAARRAAVEADLVIHTAAQVSHPRSIEIPWEDAEVNIFGTLGLLEAIRKSGRKDSVFVFCSTNKVYGDAPNVLPFDEQKTRYVLRDLPEGIDETLPIDHCMHTPFGVSKAAADLYVQEYGRLYGLKTGAFRMSCITGPFSRATIHQNWIAYFMRCALEPRPLTIYGYKGKQVRDNIDARDLVAAFDRFAKAPRPGEAYNMGGGKQNSVSCLETVRRIEAMTGKPLPFSLGPEREADHRVFITDMRKFRSHFPGWDIRIGIDRIFEDLLGWVRTALSRERKA